MKKDSTEKCADVFKAMGDQTRLAILKKLFAGEQCVTDLAKSLKMTPPRVSFHLTRLRFAGLVVDERRGQRVAYSLNPDVCKTTSRGETVISLGECTVRFKSNGAVR